MAGTVLHLHDSPQILGGATGYLNRARLAMDARGWSQVAFSLDHAAESFGPNSHSYRYPWPKTAWTRRRDFHRFHAPLATSLRAVLADRDPDLVHVQNWAVFRSTVFPVLEAWGGPVLMTVHDFSLLDPNPFGLPRNGLGGAIRNWLDRRSLVRARAAVFEAVRLFLCPTRALETGIPFPAGRTRLLRLPIDSAPAPPLPPQPLRLLFAGTLYRSKGVDVLLRALALGPAEATLEIAGSGDRLDALRILARELGLGKRVRFLGPLDHAGMNAAYARAHLLVLPSRVPENSPLTVLEAGVRARPAVGSHAGGVPELIAPPERGWTFPSEDPTALAAVFREAAEHPERLRTRGTAMREWVLQEFDPESHWDALDRIYRELAP